MRLTDLRGQLGEFLYSLLAGGSLGLLYDSFSVLRGKSTVLCHVFDGLFALCVLFGNFLLFLYVGQGTYPIFYLGGLCLGFFLWKKTLGRLYSPVFRLLTLPVRRIFALIFRIPEKIIKKCKIFLKNLFSNRKKSVTIEGRQIRRGGSLGA